MNHRQFPANLLHSALFEILHSDRRPPKFASTGNATGKGYAIFTVGGNTSFYTLDLATGSTTHKFPFSGPVKGLAVGFGL